MKKASAPSILVAVVMFAVAVMAEAQQTAKVPRLGYLSGGSSRTGGQPYCILARAARAWLRRREKYPNRVRARRRKLDRLPVVAAQLVGLKVDIIVAGRRPRTSPGCQESDQDNPHSFYIRWRSYRCRSC